MPTKRGVSGHPEPPRFYSMRTLGSAGRDGAPVVTRIWGTVGFHEERFHGIAALVPDGDPDDMDLGVIVSNAPLGVIVPDGDRGGAGCDAGLGVLDEPSDIDVLRDLLGTDPDDQGSLMSFMRRYGIARSPARLPRAVGDPDMRNRSLLMCDVVPDPLMTQSAAALALGTREKQAIERTAAIFKTREADRRAGACLPATILYAVSADEAKEAVRAARTVVSAIIDAKKEGRFPGPSSYQGTRLAHACGYASRAIASYAPTISPCFRLPPHHAPALHVAIMAAVRIALDDEPLKQCKQCGGWFQYKRPGERWYPVNDPDAPMRRRERGSDYCSQECYLNHKNEVRRKQRAREREERRAREDALTSEKPSE